MPYVDRQNRTCGFLDIEDGQSGRSLRRYFILDTQANYLLWYMDNPQNLPNGTGAVGSLKLTYISKVGIASVKQKPKATYCFVINALSQRYFLQASDPKDLQGWVDALNSASKITVPRPGTAPPPETGSTALQENKTQTAYKTEIIAGVVVQTPINQNGGDLPDVSQSGLQTHPTLRRTQSHVPLPANKALPTRSILKSGYCVKQGNMRKNWKRRYFILDAFSISYFKCEKDREPLRCIFLRDILKTHECLVKSGDLLMRDNLFEIITAPRTFYIQADSPQEMHSWIKAIIAAIQTLRMRCRELAFGRTMSLNRAFVPASPASSAHSEVKRHLVKTSSVKSPSVKSSWQPWTPIPKCETEGSGEVTWEGTKEFNEAGGRARHVSEPQRVLDKPFPFSLDDASMRTSDV
ncbi:pleckstrin homology domain-containing family A member 2 [Spea bombifrons]|uniref:pleckstrin homology domain-containing family A member 2 n=1 Tax=Spea bombifrons TaxID=233779 RepID=UPI00234928CC|nr:pleckstrin homology domain-containing family A member 2 [Spea bombifrons]